ncbi:hypothetical protein BDV26DRAFT_264738 [Aspergillus bertholletiae]|uniref:Protein root UVB sensitive/RUS domain-containing protein n=1 Tax=Aspergillus bertholletiae TaxID=1226010 RepID=A0A5N7B3Y7_9EURO|nr:hypothetical protein BDV26DRAFT_264738 [Aspergillus bertholletiae]
MASDANGIITFTEVDEVNNPTATYIYSRAVDQSTHLPQRDRNNSKATGRLDVIHPSSKPQSWSLSSLSNLLVDVFLPAGYPHSVSDDYIPYQIFVSIISCYTLRHYVVANSGAGFVSSTPSYRHNTDHEHKLTHQFQGLTSGVQ